MKTRIVLSFLLLISTANLVKPQANTQQAVTPNVYELKGGRLHVTYATTGKDGQPYLSYKKGRKTLTIKGKDIRVLKSDFGILVTVTTETMLDGESTFTLLLPTVTLQKPSSAPIQTIGITTFYDELSRGQVESYKTTELSGTAKLVLF